MKKFLNLKSSVAIWVAILAMVATVLVPTNTLALSGSDFKTGRIIDDSVFFNSPTMTPQEIQNFLNAKVPSCDTSGAKSKSYYYNPTTKAVGSDNSEVKGTWVTTTRATYGQRYNTWTGTSDAASPYTCLKDFRQNTQTRPTEAYLCSGYTGASNQSAADIIYNVSVSCGISAKALIVLLQKEQSLITDDWPWPVQYRSATGMGCPDTADCDPQYNGLFYQLYYGARQLKLYARDSGKYNHTATFNNKVLYNPNHGCGSSTVYINNQATAGLYNYTPYQPNKAALDNLYGSGDGCSAYGNRNFWRMYSDWFGSTEGGSHLLRTPDNPTVYLIVGDKKHPIPSKELMDSLYPLGPIGYVSQTFLNAKTTGNTMSRLVGRTDGDRIYFVDSGIKLPFNSCDFIYDYGLGSNCGGNGEAIKLKIEQLAVLVNGPVMPNVYGTTSGKIFYADNGQKKEVLDNQTLQNNSLTQNYPKLNEKGISSLPLGAPLIRNNTVVNQRGSSYKAVLYGSVARRVTDVLHSQSILSKLPYRQLDKASLDQVSKQEFNGFISNSGGTAHYLLTKDGKVALTDSARWSSTFTSAPDSFLNALPTASTPINNGIIRATSTPYSYYVDNKMKRPISSWEDLLRLKPNPVSVNVVSDYYINKIPISDRVLGPAKLVKHSNSSSVYLVNGLNEKVPLTTFSGMQDMGQSTSVETAPLSVLDSYSTASSSLGSAISCNGKKYFANNKGLYEVSTAMQQEYALNHLVLDSLTCANLKLTDLQMTQFIRTADGKIYYVDNGTKKHFLSYSSYTSYGGNSSNTVPVSYYGASQIPTGSSIN